MLKYIVFIICYCEIFTLSRILKKKIERVKIMSEFIKGELILFNKYHKDFKGYHGKHKHIILTEEGATISVPNEFKASMVIIISGNWDLTKDTGEGNFEFGPWDANGIPSGMLEGERTLLDEIKLKTTTEKLEISEVVLFRNTYYRMDHHHIFGLNIGEDEDGDEWLDLTKCWDNRTWNNRLSSAIVLGGIWNFFSGNKYNGNSWNLLGPAFYSTIEKVYLIENDEVSSVKLISHTPRINLNEIIIFSETNFEGRHHHIFSQEKELANARFSERVRSIIVRSGSWKFYGETRFRGVEIKKTLVPGMYPDLEDPALEEIKIASSVRQEYAK